MSVAIKICCISSPAEVELALAEGATVLGFVAEEPPGRGRLPLAEIGQLIAQVAGRAPTWLLTTHRELAPILHQVGAARPSAVQLCAPVEPSVYLALRQHHPELELVQVVHVSDASAIDRAERASPHVDAILLDSGRTSGADVAFGGTGQTHDWSISGAIVARLDLPVWLAGGLDPDNVGQAITQVRPFGVDLCSGVRDAAYRLEPSRLRSFIHRALQAGGPVELPTGASVRDLQRAVLRLEARMGWLQADLVRSGFLMVEEVGELHAAIRALLRARERGDEPPELVEAAGAEVVDVLNYLLAIANRLGVDVEEAWRRKNLENQRRTWD